MVLRFLCPNGHKIHCPDSQAGRAAKCPQCGTRFRVPALGQSGVHAEAMPADGTGDSAVNRKAAARPAEDPQIEFLCPNGHRLHGPASLQGRPGQCPDCGSRFRIPTYDDVSDEEDWEQDLGRGRVDGTDSTLNLEDPVVGAAGSEPQENLAPADDEAARQEEGDGADEPGAEAEEGAPSEDLQLDLGGLSAAGPRQGPHEWVSLFTTLWEYRGDGVTLEVILEDGQTLVPERFAQALSQGPYALFAVAGDRRSTAVAAVPWNTVKRVVLRGLKELPEELFG